MWAGWEGRPGGGYGGGDLRLRLSGEKEVPRMREAEPRRVQVGSRYVSWAEGG